MQRKYKNGFLFPLQCNENDTKSKRKDFSIHNRTKKFASSRRRGKLTKALLVCFDDQGSMTLCMGGTDGGKMASCLPPDLRNSRKVRDLIEVRGIHVFLEFQT